ncbi:MAG TPA: hypothetical protein VGG11_20880 [Xanthobacteraceae bacterium]
MAKPEVSCFECPNCRATYKLVRAEADPKTLDRSDYLPELWRAA